MSAKSTAPSCSPRLAEGVGRLAVTTVLVLFTAGVAVAQPTARQPTPPAEGAGQEDFAIATPTEWAEDTELADVLRQHFREAVGLDEHGETAGAAAYISSGTGALYVTWVKTTKPTEEEAAAKALRTVLDQLRAEPMNAGLAADAVEELEYNERLKGHAIEARMAWRHKQNETLTISRALAWQSSAKLLRVVRAECVYPESQKKLVTPICQQALVSLESLEVDSGKTLPISGLGEPRPPVASSKPSPEESSGPSLNPVDPKTPLVINNEAGKPRDNKNLWIFIIGGALVAFAFYTVIQSKRSGDDESADEPGKAADEEPSDGAAVREEE